MAPQSSPRDRRDLLELVARIPDADIPTAKRLLQSLLVDPMWLSIGSAPVEDEALSPQGEAALDHGRLSLDEKNVVSHEEVAREFGS